MGGELERVEVLPIGGGTREQVEERFRTFDARWMLEGWMPIWPLRRWKTKWSSYLGPAARIAASQRRQEEGSGSVAGIALVSSIGLLTLALWAVAGWLYWKRVRGRVVRRRRLRPRTFMGMTVARRYRYM